MGKGSPICEKIHIQIVEQCQNIIPQSKIILFYYFSGKVVYLEYYSINIIIILFKNILPQSIAVGAVL